MDDWLTEVQMTKLRVCAENNRGKMAIPIGESLLKSNPTPPPEAYYFLGISYAKTEQPQAAIKNLADYIDKAENNSQVAPALELLGKLYLSNGKKQEALAAFQQLIQLFPNTPSAERSQSFLSALSTP